MKPLDLPEVPLPAGWNEHAKMAFFGAVQLAFATMTALYSAEHTLVVPRAQLEFERQRFRDEIARRDKHIRLLQSRFRKTNPNSRPLYSRAQRFEILTLKQACGWSIQRTADEVLVARQTIANWMKDPESHLVEPPGPVNKFPDVLTTLIHSLKSTFPLLSQKRIADLLFRGGAHISESTVRRRLAHPPPPQPPRRDDGASDSSSKADSGPTVTAKYSGHVWNIDLTTVPTAFGLALGWVPFSFPPVFPFAWKVAVILDHFSRKVLGIRAFKKEPTAEDIVQLLDTALDAEGSPPKYTVTDKGCQFFSSRSRKPSAAFQAWLDRHSVKARFGAVGKKGSIAVIERFMLTLKNEGTRRLLVPYSTAEMQTELDVFAEWYNSVRPHSSLDLRTPDEMHRGVEPPSRWPRIELRARYPIDPDDVASARVRRGRALNVMASGFQGRSHLPVVQLDIAA